MIRYKYNQQVSPPAPFVHVTISRPNDETSVRDLPAQIDTAAEMTMINKPRGTDVPWWLLCHALHCLFAYSMTPWSSRHTSSL